MRTSFRQPQADVLRVPKFVVSPTHHNRCMKINFITDIDGKVILTLILSFKTP